MIIPYAMDDLTDKQRAEAGGCKVAKDFPVMENVHRKSVGLLNDPSWQVIPERVMLEKILLGRIEDALGRGQYYRWVCDECHLDKFGCGCQTIRLEGKPHIHTERSSAAIARIGNLKRVLPVDRIVQYNDGYWYYRGIMQKCKNAPTFQQCALDWFGLGGFPVAQECIATCDELGIELTGLQKYVMREKECILKAKNEKKQ